MVHNHHHLLHERISTVVYAWQWLVCLLVTFGYYSLQAMLSLSGIDYTYLVWSYLACKNTHSFSTQAQSDLVQARFCLWKSHIGSYRRQRVSNTINDTKFYPRVHRHRIPTQDPYYPTHTKLDTEVATAFADASAYLRPLTVLSYAIRGILEDIGHSSLRLGQTTHYYPLKVGGYGLSLYPGSVFLRRHVTLWKSCHVTWWVSVGVTGICQGGYHIRDGLRL